MLKKITIYLISIILLLCCSTCNKRKIDHYILSNDFKHWYAFRDGSYWIYKNEITNSLDSAFVFTFLSYTANDKKDYYGYIYDVCSNIINGSFIKGYYLQAEENFESVIVTTNMYAIENAYRTDVPLNMKIEWDTGIYELSDVYDSLEINNMTFKNVIHTKTAYPYNHTDSIYRDYYFSRNIGLIKFVQHLKSTDLIWSLLRWKTIQ